MLLTSLDAQGSAGSPRDLGAFEFAFVAAFRALVVSTIRKAKPL